MTNDDLFSIADRRTVITGGTAGIGRAVAAHFVSAGADVVITGRRAEGGQIAESIGARFVSMDVRDDASVQRGLTVLMNVALSRWCAPRRSSLLLVVQSDSATGARRAIARASLRQRATIARVRM